MADTTEAFGYQGSAEFTFAFAATAPASTFLAAAGLYYLTATADCDVRFGKATDDYAAAPSNDPGTPVAVNRQVRLVAGRERLVAIGTSGAYLSAIGVSGTGKVAVTGPLRTIRTV